MSRLSSHLLFLIFGGGGGGGGGVDGGGDGGGETLPTGTSRGVPANIIILKCLLFLQ